MFLFFSFIYLFLFNITNLAEPIEEEVGVTTPGSIPVEILDENISLSLHPKPDSETGIGVAKSNYKF